MESGLLSYSVLIKKPSKVNLKLDYEDYCEGKRCLLLKQLNGKMIES